MRLPTQPNEYFYQPDSSNQLRHCEERDSATKQSPSGMGAMPQGDCFAALAMTALVWRRSHDLFQLSGNRSRRESANFSAYALTRRSRVTARQSIS